MTLMWKLSCGGLLLLSTVTVLFAKGQITEDAAVSFVKHATASQIDRDLPQRAFGAWITDTFRDWSVRWGMSDCGEVEPSTKSEKKPDAPECVQVDIMQPPQEAGGKSTRGFHVLLQVGTEKKGLLAVPKFRAASRQEDNDIVALSSLSEVEP